MTTKKNVLLVGSGAVGTIAALNIEAGGLGSVTAVLRSNYQVVLDSGYTIESIDHGKLSGWRPSRVINTIPDIKKENLAPYDYIVCATKNTPDIPPSLTSILSPAVTPGHTIIVLIQNGLNIELPFFASFPTNTILSGVSMIGTISPSPGHIVHEFPDELLLGSFTNPNLSISAQEQAAKQFIDVYGKAGKTDVKFCSCEEVKRSRWRKLVFNACLNPICAITGLDDARIRLADGVGETLVLPAMREVAATAKKLGFLLEEGVERLMLEVDPVDLYLKPSMLVDVEKGNYIEFENLVGEPLREAEKAGVATPTLRVIYDMCKALQWRTKEAKGLVTVPPKREI